MAWESCSAAYRIIAVDSRNFEEESGYKALSFFSLFFFSLPSLAVVDPSVGDPYRD